MKKGQMQIFQNAFVLIVLIVILAFAFVIYIFMQARSTNTQIREIDNLEYAKKIQIINYLYEIQCSETSTIRHNRYDLDKINILNDYILTDSDFGRYYRGLFGYLNIRFEQYLLEPEKGWSVYNEVLLYSNTKQDYAGKRIYQIPVTLRNSTEGKDYFGIMYLEAFI